MGVIDGYSHYLVRWEPLTSTHADEVTLVVQMALVKYPKTVPEIVNDTGPVYRQGVQAVVEKVPVTLDQNRTASPSIQWHNREISSEFKRRVVRERLLNLGLAREIIGQWVDYYNQNRLHGGIRYLRPIEYYFGNPDKLIEARIEKLT